MRKISLLLGLLMASGLALAQQQGFYAGVSLGQAKVDSDASNLTSDLGTIGVTNISSSQDDTDTAWKIFGGYQFNPYLGVEGGYADFGKYNATVNGIYRGTTINASGDVDSYAIFADVVGHLPMMDNALSIFGKAGVAYTRTKLNASASGGGISASASASDSEFVPKLGLGVRYNFTKQFGIRAEYERYFNIGDKDKTGESDVDMWSIGATVNF